jgi:queuine/archaeosine tRNA-ribosyltransferase
MSDLRIDHHGKVFTVRSDKDQKRVVLTTEQHMIAGTIYLRPGARLKDVLNETETFIAVTDAQVLDSSGTRVLYMTHFMTVNTAHVAWLIPSDEIIQPSTPESPHDP